jgi:hypothetical protein
MMGFSVDRLVEQARQRRTAAIAKARDVAADNGDFETVIASAGESGFDSLVGESERLWLRKIDERRRGRYFGFLVTGVMISASLPVLLVSWLIGGYPGWLITIACHVVIAPILALGVWCALWSSLSIAVLKAAGRLSGAAADFRRLSAAAWIIGRKAVYVPVARAENRGFDIRVLPFERLGDPAVSAGREQVFLSITTKEELERYRIAFPLASRDAAEALSALLSSRVSTDRIDADTPALMDA